MRVSGLLCPTSQTCFIDSYLIKKSHDMQSICKLCISGNKKYKSRTAFVTLVLKFKKCLIHESRSDKTYIQSIGSETFKDICVF